MTDGFNSRSVLVVGALACAVHVFLGRGSVLNSIRRTFPNALDIACRPTRTGDQRQGSKGRLYIELDDKCCSAYMVWAESHSSNRSQARPYPMAKSGGFWFPYASTNECLRGYSSAVQSAVLRSYRVLGD